MLSRARNWVRTHATIARVVAYLVLAGFAIGGFAQERSYSASQRQSLAQQTYTVLVKACEHGNGLRSALHVILVNSGQQFEAEIKKGRIPADQIKEGRKQLKFDLAQVKPTDCAKQYAAVKRLPKRH